MSASPQGTGPTVAFGRYWLAREARLLMADGVVVGLNPRAVELLRVLIDAGGSPVSIDALARSVWPDTQVDRNTVQAMVSALRRALGDDRELVETVPSRGYRFTGQADEVSAPPPDAAAAPPPANDAALPFAEPIPVRVPTPSAGDETSGTGDVFIGRHAELAELLVLIESQSLVTLTGASGIGKSRLARELADRVRGVFNGGVFPVDLSTLCAPTHITECIAAAVGLDPSQPGRILDRLAHRLAGEPTLLLIDQCDGLSEAVAAAVDALLGRVPQLRVIATCEQALNAPQEYVLPLAPLRVPPTAEDRAPEAQASDAALARYDALELFCARLRNCLAQDAPHGEAPGQCADWQAGRLGAASALCRLLDGMPLALELAAAQLAARIRAGETLDDALLTLDRDFGERVARRTGSRRRILPQPWLCTVLIDYLMEAQGPAARTLLLAVSRFAGWFDLDDARAVAPPDEASRAALPGVLQALGAGCLLLSGGVTPQRHAFRLAQPVRRFAREALAGAAEFDAVAHRHARCVLRRLDAAGRAPAAMAHPVRDTRIDDLRLALEWTLAAGKFELCAQLIEQSSSHWIGVSLVDEYVRWIRRSLAAMQASASPSMRDAMRCHAALATALGLVQVEPGEVEQAWQTVYDLATITADTESRLRALYGITLCALDRGAIDRARGLHKEFAEVAAGMSQTAVQLDVLRLEGILAMYAGSHQHAIDTLGPIAAGEDQRLSAPGPHTAVPGLHIGSLCALGLAQWLSGSAQQACVTMRDAIDEAAALNDRGLHCVALGLACAVHALENDRMRTERFAAVLIAEARAAGFTRWLRAGLDFQGWLVASSGDTPATERILDHVIKRLSRGRLYLFDLAFIATLAERAEAPTRTRLLAVLDDTVVRGERLGERWHLAELSRARAVLRLQAGEAPAAVRETLEAALQLARRQRAWRVALRIAMPLATLEYASGNPRNARAILARACVEDANGGGTGDWQAAKIALDAMSVDMAE